MRRVLTAVLILIALAPALAQDKRQQARELLISAQTLMAEQRLSEAEAKILAARDLDPQYPDVYIQLGFLYDQKLGDRTRALDAYGALLAIRPDHEYGRAAFKRLFHEGPFPRYLRDPYLSFSGIGFATDQVRALTPGGLASCRVAYTTSLLYHEEMKRGQGPVEIALPVTGNQSTCLVNRSCYGFILPPESDRYALALTLSWPSEFVYGGQSQSCLAVRLMHLLLRFSWYSRTYLGLDPGAAKAYLCPQGPSGAETYKNSLFFYSVASERTPVEWARQAAHEYGHLALPPIQAFERPERLANGYLGERLFLQYLALEAGLVAGEAWPSAASQQVLAGLWPGDDFSLSDYLKTVARPSLDYWLALGPEAPLLRQGGGEDAMQYAIGFLLWAQAAHGPEVLRQIFKSAGSNAPADYVAAYRALLVRQAATGITLDAGCLNLAQSKLAEAPVEGALGRTGIKLGAGDTATYAVFLPAGSWLLTPVGVQPEMTVTVDGRGPLPLDVTGRLGLGRLQEGWHTIQLQVSDKGHSVPLERLSFRHEAEA